MDVADRVTIVANPYSGKKANRQKVEALSHAIRAQGLQTQTIWEHDGLKQAAEDPLFKMRCRAVVAAGGDGTLSHVINQHPTAPLAAYPLGNENLFARQFDFTADAHRLAQAIRRGRTRDVDVGNVDGQRFSVVVSAGFDGAVAHHLAQWRRRHSGGRLRRVGRTTYLRPMLSTFFRYRFPMMRVHADDQTVEGALAMVFNLPQYAFRLPLAPGAAGDDGLLDWLVFEDPGRIALMIHGAAVILRRHRRLPGVRHGRARRVTIEALQAEPVPVEIDGEAAGFSPLNIAVEPGALRLIDMR